MKPLLYNLSLFFICLGAIAQTKTVFNQSFDVSEIEKLELNIENIPLEIKQSPDDKIHVDFKLTFNKYSPSEKDSIIKQISFNREFIKDTIVLKLMSKVEISKSRYDYDYSMYPELSNALRESIKKRFEYFNKRKTKYDILNEVENESLDTFFKFKEEFLKKKNTKSIQANFTLLIPEKLLNNLKVEAKRCRYSFNDLALNKLDLFTDGGYLRIAKLNNSRILAWNGSVFLGEVDSSIINVDHVVKMSVGTISNSNIIGKDARIEIGEIGEYVDVKDSYSRLSLYNFKSTFKTFSLKGEYSKISFYQPSSDFSLKVYGHSTVFKYDETEQKYEGDNENKLMFKIKRKFNSDFAGDMHLQLINSKFNLLK